MLMTLFSIHTELLRSLPAVPCVSPVDTSMLQMWIMFSQTWLSLQVSKTLDTSNFQINLGGTGTPLLLTAQRLIQDSNESHYTGSHFHVVRRRNQPLFQ